MNNFQTILVAIFLAFFIFAVLIFSGLINIGTTTNTNSAAQGKIVIWGTFNNPDIYKVFNDTKDANKDLTISYVVKKELTYQKELLESFMKRFMSVVIMPTEYSVASSLRMKFSRLTPSGRIHALVK